MWACLWIIDILANIFDPSRDKRVLNLFSYTGSVSCYAIDGMAKHTTSVDLNKRYCQWHQDNCDLNGFKPDRYSIITQDVM